MKTYAILRRSGWPTSSASEQAAGRSGDAADKMTDDIHRLRTYVLDEGGTTLGSICIYQATDDWAIRSHAERAVLPIDEVVEIVDTLIVNPDPAQPGRDRR